MADYAKINLAEDRIDIWFYNENAKPLAIGEKMYGLNENAYMNGYNWDALFNYYLAKHMPSLLEGLDTDPEAGSYAAYYPRTPENEEKAQAFLEMIIDLIENEDKLYRLVQDEGDEIEWD